MIFILLLGGAILIGFVLMVGKFGSSSKRKRMSASINQGSGKGPFVAKHTVAHDNAKVSRAAGPEN